MRLFLSSVCVGLLAGCATPAPQVINLSTTFQPNEVAWSKEVGKNSVSGQSLMRTNGGEIRTCGGYIVTLTPDGAYARERHQYIYGNTTKGYRPIYLAKPLFNSEPPEYYQTARQTMCDAQGNFFFDKLPDGTYFLSAIVAWQVGYSPQGGVLMEKVTLSNGESKRLILTP